MLEIDGFVKSIIYRNKDNFYTVMVFETPDGEISAVGTLPVAEAGSHYTLTGHMAYHDKYGEQFEFQTAQFSMPKSLDSIEKYLASGILPYIGKGFAKSIVKKFGEDTMDVLDKNPARLREVRGLGRVKVDAIISALEESRASMESILYLQDLGFSTNQATRIYKTYGDNTIAVVKANPYQLIDDIKGIGFGLADMCALKGGYSPESEERILAGVTFVLDESSRQNGNTFMDKEDLLKKASSLLGLDRSLVEVQVNEKILSGRLIFKYLEDREVVYQERLFQAEDLAATRLAQMYLEPHSFSRNISLSYLMGSRLDDDQKKAVQAVFSNKISIITGGPGTGKTSIVKAIVRLAEENNLKFLLAAPTGRAAKRMEEATGAEASTIHRMLKFTGAGDGQGFFDHDQDNPLDADLIVIDEASMVDIDLMANFMDAIMPKTSLVLVGDVNQLPPVGPGNVLADLIKSGVPRVMTLEKIYRQDEDSTIVTNAHRINQGLMPEVNKGKDFFFIEGGKDAQKTLVDLVKRRLPEYYKLDPFEDIQVLSIMKKRSLGTLELNSRLQESLNPINSRAFLEFGGVAYRVGDKVIHQKNNYKLAYQTKNGVKDEGVFNGDMGRVAQVNLERQEMTVVFDDDKEVIYDKESLPELMPSYAITVHKSQGSEFKAVVIPIFRGPYMLLTRNLIYTGVTRAKDLVVLVGDWEALKTMVDNDKVSVRNSSLDYKLKEKLSMLEDIYA